MKMLQTQMKLSPAFCLHNGAVILSQNDNSEIIFGVSDPADDALCERLQRAYYLYLEQFGSSNESSAIHFEQITKEECTRAVSKLFAADSALPGDSCGQATGWTLSDDSPAVTLLNSLVSDACIAGATDIHLEGSRVRFRIGGKLEEFIVLTPETAEALSLRIKNLAHLNTLEKRRAQDGQFSFETYDRVISLRVSAMPSIEGESLVLRILDPSRVILVPEKLGFTSSHLEMIYHLLSFSDGLILVCGPTGSGKSTTQASLLSWLNTECGGAKKIITIEDPVEYVLAGVTQIQVNRDIEFDFAEVLRRVFRQDPDVIMFGEIRDRLTASVASSAALTGHLVLATLHTANADEALLRLEDLGVDKTLLKSILRGIISQKLRAKDGKLHLEGEVVSYEK